MKIYTVIRQKCTCAMACNSHQIYDVQKMFLVRYRNIHITKNNSGTTSKKYIPRWDETSSAMPYDITHHLSQTYGDKKDVKIRI